MCNGAYKRASYNSGSYYTDIYSKLDAFLFQSNDDIYGAPAVQFELLHTYTQYFLQHCAHVSVSLLFNEYIKKGPGKIWACDLSHMGSTFEIAAICLAVT